MAWRFGPCPQVERLRGLHGGCVNYVCTLFLEGPYRRRGSPNWGNCERVLTLPPLPLTAPSVRPLPSVKLEAAREGRKPRGAGAGSQEAAATCQGTPCTTGLHPPPPQVTTKACHILGDRKEGPTSVCRKCTTRPRPSHRRCSSSRRNRSIHLPGEQRRGRCNDVASNPTLVPSLTSCLYK